MQRKTHILPAPASLYTGGYSSCVSTGLTRVLHLLGLDLHVMCQLLLANQHLHAHWDGGPQAFLFFYSFPTVQLLNFDLPSNSPGNKVDPPWLLHVIRRTSCKDANQHLHTGVAAPFHSCS